EIHFWTNDPATTRIKGNSAGIRFTCRQSRSDLHGYAGNARYLRLNPDDVSCPVERLASGSRVTDVRIERDVRIHIRPDARRAGLGCVGAFGTGCKHLVLYLDEFGGLSGGRRGFRNDKRNALTGETHAIVGKRVVRCDEDRLPAAIAQRYV